MLSAQLPDTNPDTPSSILAAVLFLGFVIVSGMSWAIRTLYGQVKEERAARAEEQRLYATKLETHLRELLTVTMDATNKIAESEKSVEAAMVIIHQLQGRPMQFSQEDLVDIKFLLRSLRDGGK